MKDEESAFSFGGKTALFNSTPLEVVRRDNHRIVGCRNVSALPKDTNATSCWEALNEETKDSAGTRSNRGSGAGLPAKASDEESKEAPAKGQKEMRYTMVFALSPDRASVLMLHKPVTHRNPIFRDKWTVPGGRVEDEESSLTCAVREWKEETGLTLSPEKAVFVLRFSCNCDHAEERHEIDVFGAVISIHELSGAQGQSDEPVQVFAALPENTFWYIDPLLSLVKGRLAQPI